jgi:hypothetical protein
MNCKVSLSCDSPLQDVLVCQKYAGVLTKCNQHTEINYIYFDGNLHIVMIQKVYWKNELNQTSDIKYTKVSF